jgi:uncharacterized membrane protein
LQRKVHAFNVENWDRLSKRNIALSILLLITLLGAVARLYRLDSQSLWMDEIASLANAHEFGIGGINALAKADHVAPLHSIILWLATSIGGENAIAMRMPSVIAGVLTAPMFYLLGIRLFGSRTVGLIGATLVAISPYAVWYGQEARMYGILLLCACIYVYVAWPVVDRSLKTVEAVGLTLVTAVGLFTHHYMILLSGAFGLFLLWQVGIAKMRTWVWIATQLIAFFAFCYWLLLTADKLDNHAGLSKPLMFFWAPYTLYTFVVGLSFGPTIREIRMDGPLLALIHHAVPIAVTGLAIFVAGVAGLKRGLRPNTHTAGVWCIIWIVAPIGLAIVATLATNISFNVRYVIVSFPPVILLLSLAIAEGYQVTKAALERFQAKRRHASLTPFQTRDNRNLSRLMGLANVTASALLAVCMGASLFNWYFRAAYAKEDVRSVARFLDSHNPKLLIVDNTRIMFILAYYHAPLPAKVLRLDASTPASALTEINQLRADPSQEVWLLEYRSWETNSSRDVRQNLDATGELIGKHEWTGVSLRRYHARPAQ